MKKLFYLFPLILVILSCQTVPLKTPEIDDYTPETASTTPLMEFIGFKASADTLSTSTVVVDNSSMRNLTRYTSTNISNYDSFKLFKSDSILGNLGTTLERKNIATDKSFAYFGIYSLQELELYKSKTRYVTFVQVNSSNLSWNGKDNRAIFGTLGGTFLGCGLVYNILGAAIPSTTEDKYGKEEDNSDAKTVFEVAGVCMDIPGIIMLMVAANKKVQTEFTYEGNFDVFIYDTQNKEVLHREEVLIPSQTRKFNGFYTDSDKQKVAKYYGQLVSNELLKKYEELNKWILAKDN